MWFQYIRKPDKPSYSHPHQTPQPTITSKSSIRSDLVIPGESIFLERSDLLDQLKERFNKYPSGIQTVAIVGVGGSGKTTLARQYARLQKIPVTWEINAESREAIFNSFESLAYALSKTEKERKAVKGFQDIKSYTEKEDKLIQWVNDHLKSARRWLLIYDNVISFKNIRKYFPSDKNAWGSGQIIITTRNSHMENNNFVDHVVPIKELDADQKLSLFNKIFLNHSGQSASTAAKIQETRDFLKEIPSFPLDVTIAAYYFKTINVSYKKYLEYLKKYSKEFENIQKDILKETSEYNETRYGIITLSLKEIIEAHQDFKELLLLISLVDSQDIPRDLLTAYKSDLIVDKFIYSLKRYSLISTHTSRSIPSHIAFSIHRSTQGISLLYLTKTFNLVNGQESLIGIANSLINYIGNVVEEENIDMMKILIPHCEAFRGHHKSFSIPNNLTGIPGCMYLYLGNYVEAKRLLLISLEGLNPDEAKKSLWSIRALTYLGAAHVSLGEHKAAKRFLKQSIKGYRNYFPKSYAGYAQALRYLATAYRDTGDYEAARKLFEESLNIYQNHLPHLYVGMGRALGYVGDIYRELGKFEEARTILEQSFDLQAKYFPENPLGILWNFAPLGDVYIILGEYAKAQELLKRGLDICREYLPETHAYHPWLSGCLGLAHSKLGQYEEAKICLEKSAALFAGNRVYYAWAIRCLGAVHGELGNYEKSISLLQESLEISEKYFGKDHLEGALILTSLARVYLLKNELGTAHNLIDKALRILEKNKHPELHVSLETLADIYLKKSLQPRHQGDKHDSQKFKKKAIDALNKALKVVNTHFQENVVHKNRILQKLKPLCEALHF